MDFPVSEDVFYNWDTDFADPYTDYHTNNVIYPNSQVRKGRFNEHPFHCPNYNQNRTILHNSGDGGL